MYDEPEISKALIALLQQLAQDGVTVHVHHHHPEPTKYKEQYFTTATPPPPPPMTTTSYVEK